MPGLSSSRGITFSRIIRSIGRRPPPLSEPLPIRTSDCGRPRLSRRAPIKSRERRTNRAPMNIQGNKGSRVIRIPGRVYCGSLPRDCCQKKFILIDAERSFDSHFFQTESEGILNLLTATRNLLEIPRARGPPRHLNCTSELHSLRCAPRSTRLHYRIKCISIFAGLSGLNSQCNLAA